MIVVNCNKTEKVNCGCTLSFSSYVADSVSVLDVGTLLGASCTFTEYVIDWYRNGVHAMVSGIGANPEIQAYHPFTGTSAIPVPGGTWVPVVRYVVVNSVAIFNGRKECKKWCDTLTGLPTITVSSLYCGLIGTGVNKPDQYQYYDYRISYTSSQDYSLAYRTFYFSLNATSKWFALQFGANTVADRIQVFHSNDLNTPLTDFIVGFETVGSIADQMPYEYRTNGWFKILLELPVYTQNDFLLIKIIPSVKSGILLTDWKLDMKCLPDTLSIDYDYFSQLPIGYDITSISPINNVATCSYLYSFNLLNNPTPLINAPSLLWYAGFANWTYAPGITKTMAISYELRMAQTTRTVPSGAYTNVTSAGPITVSKTGNILSIVCIEQSDYDSYKNSWNYLMANYFRTGWLDDSTKKEYFRYFDANVTTGVNQCGEDGSLVKSLRIFIDCAFTFDDVNKTVTVVLETIVSNYPVSQDPCNTSHTLSQSFANSINTTYNLADFSITTRCRKLHPFGVGYLCASISAGATFGSSSTDFKIYHYRAVPNYQLFTGPAVYTGAQISFVEYSARVTITAPRDPVTFEYTKSPLENFNITWYVHPVTGAYIVIKVYEIIDNVVTTYIPYSELINYL